MTKFHLWGAHALRVAVVAALPTAVQHIHTIVTVVPGLAGDFFREVLVSGTVDTVKEFIHVWNELFPG